MKLLVKFVSEVNELNFQLDTFDSRVGNKPRHICKILEIIQFQRKEP